MSEPEMSGREAAGDSSAAECGSPRCAPACEADRALAALEERLTREVPSLLETMNRTSEEVNKFEAQAGAAQQRYQELLAEWSHMYEALRARHGSAIDRVKPYFDVAQVVSAASQRVQGAVREFSAATSQHSRAKAHLREMELNMEFGAHNVQLDGDQQVGLTRATVQVLRCQQERDRLEGEYAKVLREYQKSQEDLEAWRARIGDTIIKRMLPCFRQLQQQQMKLASEQNRLNAFRDRAKAAKGGYNASMRGLDRINVAIHAARHDHAKRSSKATAAPIPSKGAEENNDEAPETLKPEELGIQTLNRAPQPGDAPEETPELAPEAELVTAGEKIRSA